MFTTVVTTKGQVVIPSRIRKKMNIKTGTKFFVEDRGSEIVLKPLTEAYFENIPGILPTRGKLSRQLLEERRKGRQKE